MCDNVIQYHLLAHAKDFLVRVKFKKGLTDLQKDENKLV